MNRTLSFPYFLLSLFLLGWISLSQNATDQLRSSAVGALTFAWHSAEQIKAYLSDRPIGKTKLPESTESASLKLENQKLKNQIEELKEWILYDAKLRHERRPFLAELIAHQLHAIPASVIYRDPSSWSSSVWIGVGEIDNKTLGFPLIARNSPVVEGDSLIGVIDYVGKRQSRVRLITDSGLSPAVRVLRMQKLTELEPLIDALCNKLKDSYEFLEFVNPLQQLKSKLHVCETEVFLAKGELHGDGAPLWRSMQPILKGFGFNYDYPDEKGPARTLRTGRPLFGSEQALPLIVEGDRLVTSGLDGVFPLGLSVADVTKVFPLNEGSFSYEIEARPTAPSIGDLKIVFVLPPLSVE